MSEKRLTGRIARDNIRLMQVPRPPQGVIEGFLALGDATGIVSDAMDELGIPCGVVGAHVLRPTIPGSRMVVHLGDLRVHHPADRSLLLSRFRRPRGAAR